MVVGAVGAAWVGAGGFAARRVFWPVKRAPSGTMWVWAATGLVVTGPLEEGGDCREMAVRDGGFARGAAAAVRVAMGATAHYAVIRRPQSQQEAAAAAAELFLRGLMVQAPTVG